VGLPVVVMVFDYRTQKRLREIATKREITPEDLHFLKNIAKEHMKRGTKLEILARADFGDAVENVLRKKEMELMRLQNRARITHEDWLAVVNELHDFERKHGINPGEVEYHMGIINDTERIAEALGTSKETVSAALEFLKRYHEFEQEAKGASKELDGTIEELKDVFKEAPLIYHVYVAKRGSEEKIHPLVREAYRRAKSEFAAEVEKLLKKIAEDYKEMG